MTHKAGFVSIVGKPNAGKSTLMNALIGERLSVVSPKAQTTRHRILGILSAEDYQIVFSDTPGILNPAYKLQQRMMRSVMQAIDDADITLLVDDLTNPLEPAELAVSPERLSAPVIAVLNKSDRASVEQAAVRQERLAEWLKPREVVICSALTGAGMDVLLPTLLKYLPEHPPYYPKDELTDRSLRFLTSEIIRGKLLDHYRQEVPYASEVAIESFSDEEEIARIRALIFVERESQKRIIIGSKGSMLKSVGTAARLDIEELLGKKVYLELHVKVKDKWRQKDELLDHFGY